MNLSTKPILKELRFLINPNGPGSVGLRQYLNKNLNLIHNNKEKVNIIVRECEDIEACIIARYSFGIEKKLIVDRLEEKEFDNLLININEFKI